MLILAMVCLFTFVAFTAIKTNDNEQKVQTLTVEVESRKSEIEQKGKELDALHEKIEALREQQEVSRSTYSRRGAIKGPEMKMMITAYDLSVESCGKAPGSYGYGVTATGYCVAGLSREEAMIVAVDPNVIPLGSRVEITFDDPAAQRYNGIYTAADTGGAIGGNRIDLFMGEGSYSECMNFGRRSASVRIIR